MTEREKEATSFIHHWSGSSKIWTRTNHWSRSWPEHEESWSRIGGIHDRRRVSLRKTCKHSREFWHLNNNMLSQSILIRPLKSLIGVNNWRRCDTPVNVDVMSWMASICRTLVRAEFGKNTWSFATLWAVVKNDPLPCTRVWLKLMRLQTHVYLLRHSQPGDERLSNKEDFVDLSVIAEI